MKIFSTILLALAFQTGLFSQWIIQDSGTTEDLNELTFLSTELGFVVGDKGTLLKTIDGGKNWQSIPLNTEDELRSIHFINEAIGFIGGQSNYFAKTIDGGTSWEEIDLGTQGPFEVYFYSEYLGFVGGADQIFKTFDGGSTWSECELIDVNSFNTIYEIEFLNNTIGYALNAIGVLITTDGGLKWTQLFDDSHLDYNGANILTSIEIVSEDVIHFGSYYYYGLYSTDDGGTSFSFKERHIHDLAYVGANTGYAIDGIDGNNIIKTLEGGNDWFSIMDPNNESRFTAIEFLDKNCGWVIGWDGVIIHTETGGVLTSDPSLGNSSNENLINVYPNPTKKQLYVEVQNGSKDFIERISIYDALGKEVFAQDGLRQNFHTINLPILSNAFYFLKVNFESGLVQTKKILLD